MLVRNVGKWACILVIAWTGSNAVVSCGGSGVGSVFVDGGVGDHDSSVGSVDATGGDAPSLLGGDDGGGTGDCCEPGASCSARL